jgi:hypothetical protein
MRILLIGASLVCIATAPAAAQDGTPAARRACTPDVFRLCEAFIPDHARIAACLQQHKKQLSAKCRMVFSDERS